MGLIDEDDYERDVREPFDLAQIAYENKLEEEEKEKLKQEEEGFFVDCESCGDEYNQDIFKQQCPHCGWIEDSFDEYDEDTDFDPTDYDLEAPEDPSEITYEGEELEDSEFDPTDLDPELEEL